MSEEDIGYPLVQLVSAPSLDADVRFDFNDDRTWPDGEGFSLGVTALLGDVGSVNPDYSIKTLSFPLVLQGDEALALRKLGELARELQRDETYLFFQLTESAPPMWLRCYRSSPGDLSFATWFRDREVHDWRLNVNLAADPFAMGEQVTQSLTVGNDPATGGLVAVLDEIQGDAPAPLSVDIEAGSTTWTQPWLSLMPLDATWPGGPVFWQAESLSLTNGTSAEASATASGGSWASVPLSAYTSPAPAATRVSGDVVVPFAGRWRLFARVSGFNGAVATFVGSGAACAEPNTTTIGPWLGAAIIDLGMFVFPKGNMPSSRPYSLGAARIGVNVGGYTAPPQTNPSTAKIDYIVAIPLDLPLDQLAYGRVCEFTNLQQTSGDKVIRLDAEHEAVQEIQDGVFSPASPEVPTGGFLQAVPGASNVLTVMPRRASSSTTGAFRDDIAHTTTLTLTYAPRYLYLAGA